MSNGTMTVLGHTVEYDNHTGDTIDTEEIENDIRQGYASERLWMKNMVLCIGSWKISNPEADKWKNIAKKLYDAVISADEWSIYHLSTACNEYREAIKEQEL